MSKLTKRELQAALDALSAANNKAKAARDKISGHCLAVWGVEPGDIDNDVFIDSCDGGNGQCSGMSVDEFEQSMQECMSR